MEARSLAEWLQDWLEGHPPENVWLGTSIENQEWADKRVPELLKIPAKLRWLSVEPQLGPVDLRHIQHNGEVEIDCLTGDHGVNRPLAGRSPNKVSWVIVGGESGGKARPFDLAWADSLRQQCKAAGTPFFCKQLGARPMWVEECGIAPGSIPTSAMDYHLAMGGSEPDDIVHRIALKHPAGADPAEWPASLRVQETPS